MEFSGRTVVVTGAAGNLGRAVAAAFAARGASLALLDRTDELLRRAYSGEDARRMLRVVDLLDAAATDRVFAEASARFGRIDVLANIAGGFHMGEAVHETSAATWDFLIDTNVRTLLHAVRAAVPRMLAAGGGKIVNVGAAAALKGAAQMGAYVAAKCAVIRLTESMALELREKNVNVNCVLPSIIDTPQNRAAMPDADPRRWVAPEALADVIVFLASDAARAIHGAAVPVVGLS
ncbi:MAG: SDR family NAD(P)-dependent oxidoreductase [Sutterellaceae bacterium]|nr:SDR family NAD(P)-dependent oxidoreductase [Burkholderiaceae bacterium]MCX7902748.1 SDR family NAD(P)-dependent oxidoreductase [Burkholderiaceae bacterium]MDW8429360.1 SDR family NAD(P)-dependent oxidoreductase [Sutterellaceae bacterium]